jgi:hypothetical protein
MVASEAPPDPPANGSRMLFAVVVAVVVLVILAVFLFGGGSGASGEAPSTHTVVSHESAAPTGPAAPETAALHVLTDAEDATLYVNGEARGPLTDGIHLTLPPGAYRIEARHGASSIATRTVTLAPGASEIVTLNVPADDLLPPEGDPAAAPPEGAPAAPPAP